LKNLIDKGKLKEVFEKNQIKNNFIWFKFLDVS
jgi:hypothetical protein